MKYRILTQEEMEIFDENFKHFMIANGVTNEEWLDWNKNDIPKAEQLVALFSDTILQIVYEKMKFVEFRSKDSCIVFNCLADKMDLISLNIKENSELDLSTPESIHDALKNYPSQLTYFKTEKKYIAARELEIHQLIEGGCFNSSEEFWNALLLLVH